jgi:tRNA modification GTPase
MALKKRFLGGFAPDACLGALATERQRVILDELVLQLEMLYQLQDPCPPELPASVLQGLWTLLAKLTGEDRVETTLDHVFSGFCLGK